MQLGNQLVSSTLFTTLLGKKSLCIFWNRFSRKTSNISAAKWTWTTMNPTNAKNWNGRLKTNQPKENASQECLIQLNNHWNSIQSKWIEWTWFLMARIKNLQNTSINQPCRNAIHSWMHIDVICLISSSNKALEVISVLFRRQKKKRIKIADTFLNTLNEINSFDS